MDNIAEIIQEHRRRVAARRELPCPHRGDPSDPGRVEVDTPVADLARAWVPRAMVDDPRYATARTDALAWRRLRCEHDFEYWCATCCTIKHKTLGRDIRFELNRPQRRVAAMLEKQRLAGQPMRLIMLKARQWGGSTLVQTYMAWIQSCHCRNWHSLICAQVKDTSSGIRGMYTKLLENYPLDMWDGDEPPKFRPYERSANVREIAGRGCRVTVSSVENQDSVRGADFAMAHLSETAFWKATPSHTPDDLIRAIYSAIAYVPMSLIVMESTANGTGNYFHNEWLRCKDGRGDKATVFVPWYEIDIYRLRCDSPEDLAASFTPYERMLWDEQGCDLDQINWYRHMLRGYATHEQMMAEFPTTDIEAFTATGTDLFSKKAVERLRESCYRGRVGELTSAGDMLAEDDRGALEVWNEPKEDGRYVVAVDIGGRWARADWSVIAVLRADGSMPEVVAQWRGHIDHDLLADKACAIARWYNEALLAVESNTLESGAGQGKFILERLAHTYPNLYRRSSGDGRRVGFHTNRSTKEMIVTGLMAAVRDGSYIEHDTRACDEMLTYEQTRDGSYAAKPGNHDDILMTRAIALHILRWRSETSHGSPGSVNFRGWW